jgi:hypothetical protein
VVDGAQPAAGDRGPRVHVVPRRAVEEHAIHGTASANNLARQHEGRCIPRIRDRERLDNEVARRCTHPAPGGQGRVKDSGRIFDVAVLDNEDGFCRDLLVPEGGQGRATAMIARQLTLGKGFGQPVGDGQAGCTTTGDDEVILGSELRDLPFDGRMRRSTREPGDGGDESNDGTRQQHGCLDALQLN